MDHELTPNPERPATEAVVPGPVATAVSQLRPSQALWARVGLLGIGAAALIAAAALAFGSTASPGGTLAAGSGSNGDTNGVTDLRGGGPGFPGGRGGHFGFGDITITSISGSNLSLQTADGWTRTIAVDSGTTYTKAGETIALGDLAVGDQIGFRQTLEDDGTWSIDAIVVVLPHAGGEVTAVSGSTITLEQRDGTTATITVNGDTAFTVNGDDATLADVKVGMFLVAQGEQTGDNAILASRIRAGDISVRVGPGGPGFRFGDGDGWGPNRGNAPQATDSAS